MVVCTLPNVEINEFNEEIQSVYGFGHNLIIDNVVETLNQKSRPLITAEDALESIKLLNSIYRSIELNGKEINVGEKYSKKLGVFTPKSMNIVNSYRNEYIFDK